MAKEVQVQRKKASQSEKDTSRLTDENGRLKFIKMSDYLKTLTQGEN